MMDVGFSLPYFLVPGYYLSRLACATTLFSPSLPFLRPPSFLFPSLYTSFSSFFSYLASPAAICS